MTHRPHRADVLVVSGEPLWPSVHGGRIRTAHIVEQLARHLTVVVAAPVEAAPPPELTLVPLGPEAPVRRLPATLSPSPRLGRALLGPQRGRALTEAVARHRPRALLFATGYLAAAAPRLGVRVLVDFADVEVRRMTSLAGHGSARARAFYGLEGLKARRWEPGVARRASVSTVTTEADCTLLSAWGATALVLPNGADDHDPRPSPPDGPATFVASFGYAPNLDAARFLVERVWPLVHQAEPTLRLRLAGRHAAPAVAGAPADVEVLTDLEDVDRVYADASMIVAPVRMGGGAQLKVTEALARGRVVVASPFSARAAPRDAGDGVVVAETAEAFAREIVRLWRDLPERRAREQALTRASAVPSWEQACRPLVDVLTRAVRSG